MALLIQEVADEPGCAGCGCGAIIVPLVIIYLFRDSIISGIISFLSGLITVSLWLLGFVAIAVVGFYLIKYLIEWIKDRNI
ncbi:TPA: hypothetical protein U1629_001781 [Streptococcus suis]|uniref:hypothetical protein n=1 Tax=Streptococcus TaxID=1301 RepID=UPI0005CE7E27|nr:MULTISPECIES: hypothetical protein [Streptococcus]MCK4074351.1 DUF3810 domain-containing protein [Streptococcus suis]MDW8725652.1 hypothetical protein [Streptococcus suis]NQO22355.1 hypothetical protein [Streptococcus suis]NQO93951.1 hypothetical protein [Streptococcus suis]NQP15675.1 hypothetical protein [Streptococcus suis]